MSSNVFVKVILDTRRIRQDGLYPLKLRISHNQKSRYYALGKVLSKEEYQKAMGKAPRGEHKENQKLIIKTEEKAISCIDNLKEFEFDAFNTLYRGKKSTPTDISRFIAHTVDKLIGQDRIKTARTYSCLQTSLKNYYGTDRLYFQQITISFLEGYEKWMVSNSKSMTTIGIYLRNLRAIYNDAIANGIIENKNYPFGKRKYQIPTGKNIKKALHINEVKLIADVRLSNEKQLFSRDMWLFSYLANGANMTDLFALTEDNISDGFIVFRRSKTMRMTRHNPIHIRVFITTRMRQILDYWKPENSSYLFPVLENYFTPQQKVSKVENTIKFINKYMKQITQVLGIKKQVTTYTARHSFSTVLKRSGASISFISESLGHKNISTTAYYLDSFEDDEKMKWSERLL